MANKRDTSRQKRARENRAQRSALAARTKGAPPARPSRVAPATADRLKKTAESKSSATGKGDARTTRSGKPRRERPPRPGDKPVDVATLEGSWFSRLMHVPGGTQVLFAGVMAILATGLMSFSKLFVSAEDAGTKNAKATQTIFEFYSLTRAVPLLVVPLAIAGAAVAFSFHPQRRRIWLGAAMILGLVAAFALQFYLFVAGFLGYAVFRSAKVEGPSEPILRSLFRSGKRHTDSDSVAEDT